MRQILHRRNRRATVSDEAERVQHTPTLNDWLQLKGVGGGTSNSYGILALPPLHEICIKSLLFPKVDHSFGRYFYRLQIIRLTKNC